jgi:hypothetical protein
MPTADKPPPRTRSPVKEVPPTKASSSSKRPGRNGLVLQASPMRPRSWAERTAGPPDAIHSHSHAYNIPSPNLARHVLKAVVNEHSRQREMLVNRAMRPPSSEQRRASLSGAASASASATTPPAAASRSPFSPVGSSGGGGKGAAADAASLSELIAAERNTVYLNLLLAHAKHIPAVRRGKPVQARGRAHNAAATSGSALHRSRSLPPAAFVTPHSRQLRGHPPPSAAVSGAGRRGVAPRQVPRRSLTRAQSMPRFGPNAPSAPTTTTTTTNSDNHHSSSSSKKNSGWDFLTGVSNTDDHHFTSSLAAAQRRPQLSHAPASTATATAQRLEFGSSAEAELEAADSSDYPALIPDSPLADSRASSASASASASGVRLPRLAPAQGQGQGPVQGSRQKQRLALQAVRRRKELQQLMHRPTAAAAAAAAAVAGAGDEQKAEARARAWASPVPGRNRYSCGVVWCGVV